MALVGFTRPSLSDITTRLEAEVDSRLPSIDATLRQSVLNVLIQSFSGALHSLYGFADWIADQCNVLYCAGANLDAFGLLWDVSRKVASPATGTATLPGAIGSIIPADAELQTGNNLRYAVTTAVEFLTPTVTIALESVADGIGYNLPAGTKLQLAAPVAGVTSTATVVTMTGGADVESDEAYRARILSRLKLAAHGGNAKDFVDWALQVPGVTRAWCFPYESGPGSVALRFMMDDVYNGVGENGIPQAGDVAAVAAYLETLRPVTCSLYVYAPVAVPLDVEITALTPNDPTVKMALVAELKDTIQRNAEPGGTLYTSDLWQAVAQATGVRSFRITAPTDDVDFAPGEIGVLGNVTYVTV